MDAATLLLLTSSVGVGFGWQPMPDGTPRIEYLVQIEPEMLTALQAGSAIPIVSEVPEDIGPLGRVRIVIGRAALPRQGLPKPQLDLSQPNAAIRHKPNSAAPSPNISAAPPASIQPDSTVLRTRFIPSVSAGSASTRPVNPGPRYAQQSGTGPSNTSSLPMPPQNTLPSAISESPLGGNMFQKAIEAGERQAAAAQAGAIPQVPPEHSIVRGAPLGTSSQPSGISAADTAAATGVVGTMGIAGTPKSLGSPTTSDQPTTPGSLGSNPYPSAGAAGVGMTGTRRLAQPLPVDTTIGAQQTVASQRIGEGGQDELKGREVAPGLQKSYSDRSAILTEVEGLSAGKGPSVSKVPAPKFPNREQNSQAVGKYHTASMKSSGQPPPGQLPTGQLPTGQLPTGLPAMDRAPNGISQGDLASNTPIGADNQSASGFMLVLAWVLLIGSVAGNFYLLWSYLNIRGKYHAMIRSNRGSHPSYSRAA